MDDGHGVAVAHKGGDARVTRYDPLANPLRFPRLDAGPPTGSRQGSQDKAAERSGWSPAFRFGAHTLPDIGHYHKSCPITTSCKALHASNFPVKMGRWDMSKLEHRIGSHESTRYKSQRSTTGRIGPR